MATQPKLYCYVATIPQEGYITIEDGTCRQNVCYFRFGDSINHESALESALQNPGILVIARKVNHQGLFPNNNANAGAWLQQVIFLDRGFERVTSCDGNVTSWFKIYLRPGQLTNIRTFLTSWRLGSWKLESQAGQVALYNHLINDVFIADSKQSLCAGRGGYNSTEKEERRDSAFD